MAPMETLRKEDISRLMKRSGDLCVSMYMPVNRKGAETRQNPIHLKNALQEAEKALEGRGWTPPDIGSFLEPVSGLVEDESFWKQAGDGLAVLLGEDFVQLYRLPRPVEPFVHVGRRFHLKPMLFLMTGDLRFHLLAVSRNRVRLYDCTRFSIRPVESDRLPRSMEDTLRFDDPQKQLQFHTRTQRTGGRDDAVFHGQGVGSDEETRNLQRFCQDVDRGMRETLGGRESAPLVFAGVEELFGMFQKTTRHPLLMEDFIAGNFDEADAGDLHDRAWRCVEPILERERQEAEQRYYSLRQDRFTSNETGEIVPGAFFGKVDDLFLAEGARQWGAFDPEQNAVEVHAERQTGADDLLDLAAVYTLINGGAVYAVPADRMPDKAMVAATFRY